MEKGGDVVIVGRAVGYDGDAAPEPAGTGEDGPGAGFFRYEMDPAAMEPSDCRPVWDGEN